MTTTATPNAASGNVTRSVIDLVSDCPDVDNQMPFDTLWRIFSELQAKIDARFDLTLDPSAEKFQSYDNGKGEGQGTINAMSGPEMDWLIHSWMGTPKSTFTNMHLTGWLGPQSRVPHLWMALGTIPDLFVYFDYGPRCDMYAETAYMDRYYEPANDTFMQTQNDSAMPAFISQDLCTRQFISPTGICLAGVKATGEMFERISEMAHAHVDRWLGWVDEAEPVAEAARPALAARDLHMRRTIAERDPANALAVKLYGEAMTDELVGTLWGRDRKLARPS